MAGADFVELAADSLDDECRRRGRGSAILATRSCLHRPPACRELARVRPGGRRPGPPPTDRACSSAVMILARPFDEVADRRAGEGAARPPAERRRPRRLSLRPLGRTRGRSLPSASPTRPIAPTSSRRRRSSERPAAGRRARPTVTSSDSVRGPTSTSPPRPSRDRRTRTASCAPPATRARASSARRHARPRLRARRPFDDVYAAIAEPLSPPHGERRGPVRGPRLAARARTIGARLAPTSGSMRVLRRCRSSTSPGPASASIPWRPASAGRRPRVRHRRGRGGRCSSPTPTPTGCSGTSSWRPRRPTGDDPVVILQRLGTPDESITNDVERARPRGRGRPPHVRLRPPSVPGGVGYVRFHQLARTLREQCPWDREQTHASPDPVPRGGDLRARRCLEALDPDDPPPRRR